jgi:hypothetical protein
MKNDKARFTIRFNEADPRQLKTMAALEAAGRRKASFIADAVCDYLARHGDGTAAVILPFIPSPSKVTPHKEVQATKIESAFQTLESESDLPVANMTDNPSFNDDIRDAIMEGLGAFNF